MPFFDCVEQDETFLFQEFFLSSYAFITKADQNTDQDFDIFDRLFEDKLLRLRRLIEQSTAENLPFKMSAISCEDIALSFFGHLRRILQPVIQANYEGFISLLKKENLYTNLEEARILFLKEMADHGVRRLFETKPALKKIILQIIKNWQQSYRLFFKRLESDKEELADNFNLKLQDDFSIDRLYCDLSDPHNGCETVRIIKFNNKQKIVYKPRPLDAEQALYEFIGYARQLGLQSDLYRPKVLTKDFYGWMEFCPQQPVDENTPLQEHAYQYGALTALWFLLGGTDLHNENVLFTPHGPVITDAETAFGYDFNYDYTENSIDKIPLYQVLRTEAVESSVVGNGAFNGYIENFETKTIHHVNGISLFRKNIKEFSNSKSDKSEWYDVPLNREGITWNDVADSVASGIEETLIFAKENASLLVQKALLLYRGCRIRVVVRPTAQYGYILRSIAQDFEAIRDAEKIKIKIQMQLRKILPVMFYIFHEDIIDSEISQLFYFDIPYFYRVLGGNEVRHGDFSCAYPKQIDFLSMHVRYSLLDKNFCKKEAEKSRLLMIPKSLQSSYYECALNQRLHVYQENTFDMDWFKCSREKKAPLQAIEKIAKQVQTFIENTGSVQNNYVLQDIKDEDFFQIQTQGYGLYAGFVGQLIFLAAYAKFSSDPKISALVKRYAEELLDFIQSEFFIFKEGRSGLGGGCQSLLYGLYTLSQLGFIVIPPHCLSRFFSIEPKLWAAPIVDLIDGVSGDIILQRHFLKHVPDDIYKRQSSLLSTLSRSLLLEWDKNSNDRKKIGLAHGALGPAWACALIFKQTGNEEFKKYAEDLICKEKEMITGIHAKNPSGYENNNWCYGNAGKALAYHEIGKLLNDDVFQSEAIRMADFKNKEKLKFLDPSLCCGAAGYFAAYTYILQPGLGRSEIENIEALKSEYVRLMSCVEPFEAQKKHMNLGLFKGASGFGYALLYYILPEKIPPVWVFG